MLIPPRDCRLEASLIVKNLVIISLNSKRTQPVYLLLLNFRISLFKIIKLIKMIIGTEKLDILFPEGVFEPDSSEHIVTLNDILPD
jgi:hypothetical protein